MIIKMIRIRKILHVKSLEQWLPFIGSVQWTMTDVFWSISEWSKCAKVWQGVCLCPCVCGGGDCEFFFSGYLYFAFITNIFVDNSHKMFSEVGKQLYMLMHFLSLLGGFIVTPWFPSENITLISAKYWKKAEVAEKMRGPFRICQCSNFGRNWYHSGK